jgi:hypothetical protein
MDCIACKSDIPEGSIVCKHCNYAQNKWRNWLPHIGTALAVITFVLGGFTYMGEKLVKGIAEWRAKDGVQVVFLDSEGATGIMNTGDKDIVVLDIDIILNQFKYSTTVSFYKRISPTEFVTVDETPKEEFEMDKETMVADTPYSKETYPQCFNKENSYLKGNKVFFPNLKTFPATGVLTYYSTIEKKQKTITFDCECTTVRIKPNQNEVPAKK